MQAWPRAEGFLFPGLTIAALAVVGVAGPWEGWRDRRLADPVRIAPLLCCGVFIALAAALLLGYSIRLPFSKITSFARTLMIAAAAAAIALGGVARTRAPRSIHGCARRRRGSRSSRIRRGDVVRARHPRHGPHGRGLERLCLRSTITCPATTACGCRPDTRPSHRSASPRSPAAAPPRSTRATGAREPCRRGADPRRGDRRAYSHQSELDVVHATRRSRRCPRCSTSASRRRPCTHTSRSCPASAALLELPLGEPAFDVRYMYYSTTHWRRLVNGYSGGEPREYQSLAEALKDTDPRPARAWGRAPRVALPPTSSCTKRSTRITADRACPHGCGRAARARSRSSAGTTCSPSAESRSGHPSRFLAGRGPLAAGRTQFLPTFGG